MPSKSIQDEFIKHLTDNSLYFFMKGVNLFEDDPKISVICFSTAVELMLKARLAYEHWALVFNEPNEASIDKAMSGDFVSAKPSDVIKRIASIANEKISDKEIEAYKKLASKRNTIIHFSEELIAKDELIEITTVAFGSIYYMYSRIDGSWGNLLSIQMSELWTLSSLTKSFKPFLQTKFDVIKPEIAKYKKRDETIINCSRCDFKSRLSRLQEQSEDGTLIIEKCLVCLDVNVYLIWKCSECGKGIRYDGFYEICECESCEMVIDFGTILDNNSGFCRDSYEHDLAYCSECEFYEMSVMPFGCGYLCLNCLTFHDDVESCEYCNESIAGFDSEHSYIQGCIMCEGKKDW